MAESINVTIAATSISVTIDSTATWDTLSGKPTATAQYDFIISGTSPYAWGKKSLAETRAILTDGFVTNDDNYNSNQTIDCSIHKDHKYYYITGNVEFNISNASDGDAGMLIFIVDGTGGYTITLGAAFTKCIGGTISNSANTENVISWRKCGSDIYYTIAQVS